MIEYNSSIKAKKGDNVYGKNRTGSIGIRSDVGQ